MPKPRKTLTPRVDPDAQWNESSPDRKLAIRRCTAILTKIDDIYETHPGEAEEFLGSVEEGARDMMEKFTKGRDPSPAQMRALRNWGDSVDNILERLEDQEQSSGFEDSVEEW